jgi:hypothetical protein
MYINRVTGAVRNDVLPYYYYYMRTCVRRNNSSVKLLSIYYLCIICRTLINLTVLIQVFSKPCVVSLVNMSSHTSPSSLSPVKTCGLSPLHLNQVPSIVLWQNWRPIWDWKGLETSGKDVEKLCAEAVMDWVLLESSFGKPGMFGGLSSVGAHPGNTCVDMSECVVGNVRSWTFEV